MDTIKVLSEERMEKVLLHIVGSEVWLMTPH